MDSGRVVAVCGILSAVVAGIYVVWGPNQRQTRRKRNDQLPGLENLGNLCFLNAVLQALASCPSFLNWLTTRTQHVQDDKSVSQECSSLCEVLSNALKILNNQSRCVDEYYNAADVLRVLHKYNWVISNEEQDAHEMFLVLTSTLEEETISRQLHPFSLNDARKLEVTDSLGKSVKTLLNVCDAPYKGLLASQLICKNCGHKFPLKYDTFDSLPVIIPDIQVSQLTLQMCLKVIVTSELVHDVDCEVCAENPDLQSGEPNSSKATFIKHTAIGKLPQCLCIHIQRTVWLKNGMPTKIFEHVHYPEYLCMDDFIYEQLDLQSKSPIWNKLLESNLLNVDSNRLGASTQSLPNLYSPSSPINCDSSDTKQVHSKKDKYLYCLQAVIVHLGSASSGHFVTYRRGPIGSRKRSKWYFTSDSFVREASLEEVLQSNAYMLLYERVQISLNLLKPMNFSLQTNAMNTVN